MKTWKKVLIGSGGFLFLLIAVGVIHHQIVKDVVTVQTARVIRQDVTSLVSASGEIRPRDYTNVLGEGIGKITEIVVHEGQQVKRGDVLLRLESIQPAADVQAQEATIGSTEAGVRAAEAGYKSAQAALKQRQADFQKAQDDWKRGQELYAQQLIAKQDYDSRKAAFDGAAAGVDAAEAQLQQQKAALEQIRSNLSQNQAVLKHSRDVLRKTTYTAPIGGIVTYIAVRVGENVVPGIQNATGSYLMTISDMSVVTADVKVDETDIVNVRPGQSAEATIDAFPGKVFHGVVDQVGNQAILRTSGLATTQTTANTQEARDFEVIITLDNPPVGLRPGLSTTTKIHTAQKKDVLTIPLQALVTRTAKDLEAAEKQNAGNGVTLAAPRGDSSSRGGPGDAQTDVQGVFVVRGGRAVFVPVQTGITGITDIEVTGGLAANDEIVSGSYKALRSLKPHARIKVDNSAPKEGPTF